MVKNDHFSHLTAFTTKLDQPCPTKITNNTNISLRLKADEASGWLHFWGPSISLSPKIVTHVCSLNQNENALFSTNVGIVVLQSIRLA